MGHPARYEIEKFANDAFAIARDRLLTEYAGKQSRVLGQVRLTGNSGGYRPALIRCEAERVRGTILALADAYVEAFTHYGVPSDLQAEKILQTSAQQIAAGSLSGIRGQIDLMEKRTRMPLNDPGGHLPREIKGSIQSALKEGVLRLRRQRIKCKHSESPLQRLKTSATDDLAAAPALPNSSSTLHIASPELHGANHPPPSQDPIQENPAPIGHPAHRIWIEATLQAELEISRFEEKMLEAPPESPAELDAWSIKLALGKFQIWAKRGLCIVRNSADARAYAHWLESYLHSWLKLAAEENYSELLLLELRLQLLRAAKHWSGNALEQAAALGSGTGTGSDGGEHDRYAADTLALAERAARRRAVVMPILTNKRWKPGRLATEAGVGKNSVYEYIDGTRVKITDDNRQAIADALGLRPEQIPD